MRITSLMSDFFSVWEVHCASLRTNFWAAFLNSNTIMKKCAIINDTGDVELKFLGKTQEEESLS